MTDREYLDLTKRLDSFTESAADLRDVWSGKKKENIIRAGGEVIQDETHHYEFIILSDGSMLMPKELIRLNLSNAIHQTVKPMDGCDDFSSYRLAPTLYQKMDKFVSVTSDLQEDLNKLFSPLQDRCLEIMALLKPSKKAETRADNKKKATDRFVKELMGSEAFANAKKDGWIDDQLNWTQSLDLLAAWLYKYLLIPVTNDEFNEEAQWFVADHVFTNNGKDVTKDMLAQAFWRAKNKDLINA
jgi:hypothetical protein